MKKEKAKPIIGWMTRESYQRFLKGGNESRNTVPLHVFPSRVAVIPVKIVFPK